MNDRWQSDLKFCLPFETTSIFIKLKESQPLVTACTLIASPVSVNTTFANSR